MRFFKLIMMFLFFCYLSKTVMAEVVDPGISGYYDATQNMAKTDKKIQIQNKFGKIPLTFEDHSDSNGFLARGSGYQLWIGPTGSVMTLSKPADPPETSESEIKKDKLSFESTRIRMKLEGANPSPQGTGLEKAITRTHYLNGNDPTKWRRNIPNYSKVEYKGVYPGVDVVYYGNQRKLEYDFIIQPGADYHSIQLAFEGTQGISLDAEGNLVLVTANGKVIQQAPIVYQEIDGKRITLQGAYLLAQNNQVQFQVNSYDPQYPLVIDPVLHYSTYLGATAHDLANAIAVNANGEVYVTGNTNSFDFPTAVNPYDSSINGQDVFLSKLNATGDVLLYSTFLGGSGGDDAIDIAVDATGVYIAGNTNSTNFPISNAYQAALSGSSDAFLLKLSVDGSSLLYSTYFGGSGSDNFQAIATDSSGIVYITGYTTTSNFPTTTGVHKENITGSSSDAFLIKINTTLSGTSSLEKSTLFGGDNSEEGLAITLNSGNIYLAGITRSLSNIATSGAYDESFNGSAPIDSYIAIMDSSFNLLYSTYFGGAGNDYIEKIEVDVSGSVYILGHTFDGTGFPILNAYDNTFDGYNDKFVAKLNLDGTGTNDLVFSTFLGGLDQEGVGGNFFVDTNGVIHIAGWTGSSDFPTTSDAYQLSSGGSTDGFYLQLSADGSTLQYSTYIGGSNQDKTLDMATFDDNVYLAGLTLSTDYPTLNAFQSDFSGNYDSVITAFSDAVILTPPDSTPPVVTAPGTIDFVEATGPFTTVSLENTVTGAGNSGVATATEETDPLIITPFPARVLEDLSITNFSNNTVDLPVGSFTVVWEAVDTALNVGNAVGDEAVQTVVVKDTTGPVITITPFGSEPDPAVLNLIVGTDYEEPGATADDDVDGTFAATVGGDTVNTSVEGFYTVTYNATDNATPPNPATEVTRIVNITAAPDTTPPICTPPADKVNIPATGEFTIIQNLGTATGNEPINGANTTNTAPSGGFPEGQTTPVNWTVTDTANNVSTNSCIQNVIILPLSTGGSGDNRIVINSLPFNIESPGSYVFDSNLVHNNPVNGSCITVNSDNVTIDMNGYSLIGPGQTAGCDCDGISTGGRSNVRIKNGNIQNFAGYGIYDPALTAQGVYIQNVGVNTNGKNGIFLNGKGHTVTNSTITNNLAGGIFVEDSSTIISNTVNNNTGSGISTNNGSTVNGNNVFGNTVNGIVVNNDVKVSGNTVYENTGDGITSNNGCSLTENTVNNNTGTGIVSGPATKVKGNTCYLNSGSGISAGAGSTIADNTVYGNNQGNTANQGGIVASGNTLIKCNQVTQNLSQNMLVSGSGNAIQDNLLNNSEKGINFTSAAGTNNFFSGNKAFGNTAGFTGTGLPTGAGDPGNNVEFNN